MVSPVLVFPLFLIIYTNRDVWGYALSYPFYVSILRISHIWKQSYYTGNRGGLSWTIEKLADQVHLFVRSTWVLLWFWASVREITCFVVLIGFLSHVADRDTSSSS